MNSSRTCGSAGRFSQLTVWLTATHSLYELCSGVGLPGQIPLGLPGAVAAHAAGISQWHVWVRGRTHPRTIAVANGLALAGAISHYIGRPVRRSALGLSLQPGAEGMPAPWVGGYDLLLHVWAVSALLAIQCEGRRTHGLTVTALALPILPLLARWSQQRLSIEQSRHNRWSTRALAVD